MNRFTMMIAGLGIAVAAMPVAANAGPRHAVAERQFQIEHRIDAGLRNGSLSPREARSLQDQYRQIARLEARYRYSGRGLTRAEARDLNYRYAALERRVRYERHDGNYRPGYYRR